MRERRGLLRRGSTIFVPTLGVLTGELVFNIRLFHLLFYYCRCSMVIFETYYYYNFSFDNLCFLSGCILEFKEKFSGAIEILEFGSSVAYIFIFAGGAYIALKII